MPVTHKEVSNGHLLCTAGMIEYYSKNLIMKFGGIIMKSIFEQNGGTYTKIGKYYIPNVSVPDTKKYNIGKYGRMHAKFIKQNKFYIYSAKMLNGTWLDYLEEIDNAAREMVDKIIRALANEQGITEELKAKDQFTWISAMEQIKHTAEEFVFLEIIYK